MFTDQLRQIEEIKSKIYDEILSLPQNDKIKIISDKPRCFTIMSSELIGRVLSPEYYDFEQQYKALVKRLSEVDIMNFENVLSDIICKKRMIIKNGDSTRTYIFHPLVIQYLTQISK